MTGNFDVEQNTDTILDRFDILTYFLLTCRGLANRRIKVLVNCLLLLLIPLVIPVRNSTVRVKVLREISNSSDFLMAFLGFGRQVR